MVVETFDALNVAMLARAEDLARADLYTGGRWHADYRRIRVVAVRDPSLAVE